MKDDEPSIIPGGPDGGDSIYSEEYEGYYTVRTKKEIKKYLSRYIKGQDALLDKLSFMSHLYSRKVFSKFIGAQNRELPKTNFFITGPTGCGKTYIIKTLSDALEVPYFRIDCSALTGEGWKGASLSDFILCYIKECVAGVGILHLDEFDKLGLRTEDTGGLESQMSLLDLLDGSYYHKSEGDRTDLNRVNHSFIIMSGSFQTYREQQSNIKAPIRFNGSKDEYKEVIIDWRLHFKKLGILPELANRIVTSAELKPYTKKQIDCIVQSVENNPYDRYRKLINRNYSNLSKYTLNKVVSKVYKENNGMREIESILFEEIYKNETRKAKKK